MPDLYKNTSTNNDEDKGKEDDDIDEEGLGRVGGEKFEGGGLICEGVLVRDGGHGGEEGLVVADGEAVDDGDCDFPEGHGNDEEEGVSFHCVFLLLVYWLLVLLEWEFEWIWNQVGII